VRALGEQGTSLTELFTGEPRTFRVEDRSIMVDASENTIALKVCSIRRIAEAVIAIELRGAGSTLLPPFSAGAHIPLHLANGLIRSYSLTNSEDERERYVIAVGRDIKSRGGSQFIHEQVQVGDVLAAGMPRNNFPYDENAAYSVFIAGGIGVTPLVSMIRRAVKLRRAWEIHYCARSRGCAAFLDEIGSLSGQKGGLRTHFDDESEGRFIDLERVIGSGPSAAHFYCCGPEPMLAAFRKAAASLTAEQVHFEYFKQVDDPERTGGFTVRLARRNRSVYVPPGRTILEALHAEGIDAPAACREGVCGTCEVRVLEGVPIHRDSVLTPAERERNQTMMICCSGSETPYLTIDL